MLKNQWSKKEIEDSEYEIHHRALSEEYSFFEAVKDGNIEAVSNNLKEEAFTNPEGMGILSKNPLTNLKYHFVITVALVTRYCIPSERFLHYSHGCLQHHSGNIRSAS